MAEPCWAPSKFFALASWRAPSLTNTFVHRLPVYEEGRSFQLPEVHAALERLGNSATGIRRSRGEGYQLEHTLVLTLQNDSTTSESDAEKLREIRVDMSNSSMGKAQMRIMESWARLDWTVLAPDR